jgi:hypothetical protein
MSRELNGEARRGQSLPFTPVSKRSVKLARLAAGLCLIAALAHAQTMELRASHVRFGKACAGTLRFEATQLRWTPGKATRACKEVAWPYGEMQKLAMEERRIEVTGYRDRKRRLGADERYTFRLTDEPAGAPLYALLRTKMDSRFAPRWADPSLKPEWSVPAKMLSGRFPAGNWGGEGKLSVADGGLTFSSEKTGYSRTWLDKEIENVAAEPPFRLTLAVREGGVAKLVEFQLKQELDAAQFDALWRRLNRSRGLKLLNDIEEQSR